MLRTLVVGLGRAGAGLHLPVLAGLRKRTGPEGPFADAPVVACDPELATVPGTVAVDSIERAMGLLDPARTVVHVCTPPTGRVDVVAELAGLGFTRFVVDKPLAATVADADAIEALRDRHGLDVVVVAHWLTAALTARLEDVVRSGRFGALRALTVAQHKPRFTRTVATAGHPTAFDVEVPHSLGVVLRLAGPAELVDATWSDLTCVGHVVPRMGGARMTLRHGGGLQTSVHSDLMSPTRQRRITLRLDHAMVTADYPLGDEDDHAQLRVVAAGRDERAVFPDDALAEHLLAAYRHFAGERDPGLADLAPHREVVRLLEAAKTRCASSERHSAGGITVPAQERRAALDHVR